MINVAAISGLRASSYLLPRAPPEPQGFPGSCGLVEGAAAKLALQLIEYFYRDGRGESKGISAALVSVAVRLFMFAVSESQESAAKWAVQQDARVSPIRDPDAPGLALFWT